MLLPYKDVMERIKRVIFHTQKEGERTAQLLNLFSRLLYTTDRERGLYTLWTVKRSPPETSPVSCMMFYHLRHFTFISIFRVEQQVEQQGSATWWQQSAIKVLHFLKVLLWRALSLQCIGYNYPPIISYFFIILFNRKGFPFIFQSSCEFKLAKKRKRKLSHFEQ